MTLEEAKELVREISKKFPYFTEEEQFQVTELSKFIFEKEKNPSYLDYLAAEVFRKGNFDLALYYYELAIQYGHMPAYYDAARLYREGSLSSGKDLKKAFEYFTIASKSAAAGDGTFESPLNDGHYAAKLELAKMYKNGEYVEQNHNKYKKLVNEVYKEVQEEEFEPHKYDVINEMAKIFIEEGKKEKACDCLFDSINEQVFYFECSKDAELLSDMEETVEMLYGLIEFDPIEINFPDLFHMVKKPCKLKFKWKRKNHTLEVLEDNGSLALKLDDNWYRDILDMISNAEIGKDKMVEIASKIDTWEVLEWKN